MAIEYLITGGAGFIGSNMAEHLMKQHKSVRIFDNLLTGNRANLLRVEKKCEILEGDLRDLDQVRRAVQGVRYILHAGALPSVPRSVEDPRLTHEINVGGTLNVLLAARDAGCQRVVFSSSSSVYGDTSSLPEREDMMPCPLSPYAVQKLTGEYYGRNFWQLYGLETVSLRYFNVFGPRQDPLSDYAAVIPKFITSMLTGQAPTVFGDGTQSRDFSYIDNIIDSNLAACVAPHEALGASINIACGDRITLLELIDVINQIEGNHIKPRFGLPRPGDIIHSQADITKAKELLNWEPRVDFREGIEKTIHWYRHRAD